MTNKLWLVSQYANSGYDTYEGFVVFADSADEARNMKPKYDNTVEKANWDADSFYYFSSWVRKPEDVKVEFLGTSHKFEESGTVVLMSFNAG